jgi:RHS repeat-associated protein
MRALKPLFFLLVALLLLLSPLRTSGQSAPNQINPGNATGVQPYNTYGGVRENVNLPTGNLNLQVPLLKLLGRDGFDVSLSLIYDSKIWILHHDHDIASGQDLYWWDNEYAAPSYASFWRLNLPYMVATWRDISNPTNPIETTCWTDFIVYTSDGSKHYFANQASCWSARQGQVGAPDPSKNTPVVDSDDGAYLRLDTTNTADIVLHTKEGTSIHFLNFFGSGGFATADKIVDTNGNKISIQKDGNSNPVGIADTLGRLISFNAGNLTSISYNDSSGTSRTITFSYTSATIAPTFVSPPGSSARSSTGGLLSVITLPSGLTYGFQYNSFGELIKVTYPTGGYTRYDYGRYTNWWAFWWDPFSAGIGADFREVTARYVCGQATGSCATEETTTYSPTVDSGKTNNQFTDVRDATPAHNRTRSQFSFQSSTDATQIFSPRELNRYIYQGESTLLRTVQTYYDTSGCTNQGPTSNSSLPRCAVTTLNDTNQVSKVEWDYDTYTAWPTCVGTLRCYPAATSTTIDNVLEKREYDWGSAAPGVLVRKTDETWLKTNPVNNQDYTSTAIFILDRKASEQIKDAAGNIVAQSQFEHDSFTEGLTASGAVQHDSGFGTGYTTRGDLTAAQRWRNTDGVWLTTRNQYDDAGNVRKTTDPGTHVTTFSYADSWGNAACAPIGGTAAAYRTSVTNALNQVTSSTYNSCSGTVASTTDPNNQTTTFSYDLMGRLTQTNLPDGGQATRAFNEASTPLSVTSTAKITSAMNVTAPVVVDGLGRVTTARLDSDPQGVTYTDTTYDALGRKSTVSNPHRSTSAPTDGITTFNYDALSRVTQVIPPDGTSTANNATTVYSGNTTTVTDQAGKTRKSATDALGRLITVWEPDASGNFVNETDYQYDVLNNLLRVDQKGNTTDSTQWRTRTFVYNSLSQLTNASNPESGTIGYTYDNDGNLLTKTAPAPNQTGSATVITTYAYDALHRLTGKTYSNGDPAASYRYDEPNCLGQPACFNVGRRTSMTDAAGSEAWSYDKLGRALTDQRTTNGVTKNTSYTYNLDGSVATLTYPSGRVITYTPNAAGRTVSAVDNPGGVNYATGALYAPQGALSSLQNGANLTSTLYYNNRLQPCRISVKTTGTAPTQCSDSSQVGDVLDLTYDFGLGTADNGNVNSVTNNRNTARSISYSYDELNRVRSALTNGTTGNFCWGLDYTYDIWANLKTVALDSARPACSWGTLNVTITAANRISGTSYDAAGSVLNDGSYSYTYNAEGQMTAGAGVTYTSDGDGRRVQKSSGNLYWYGVGSDPIAESDVTGATWTNEYVFFGGKRIARRDSSGNVFYYFTDHLGTSRVIVQAGQTTPCYDADFDPFGGEHIVTNTCPQNYKFTGKERDSESGLDDLGARYYSSQYGRFMSGDLVFADQHVAEPQSWNLYTYVRNRPLGYIDPTGHAARMPHGPPLVLNGDPGNSDGVEVEATGDYGGTSSADPFSSVNSEAAEGQQAQQPAPAQQPQQQQQPSMTLTLGRVKVDVTFSAIETSAGNRGVEIEANPQGCGDCRWAQTTTRTGTDAHSSKTDRALPNQPLYPTTERMNGFYDQPSTQKGGAGTFRATTTLGIADQKKKTFRFWGRWLGATSSTKAETLR